VARVALPESKIKARRKRRRIIALSLAVLCVAVLCAGFVWLANASFAQISTIEISGAQTIATSTIEQKVKAQLVGSYLYLFPKNNILFYPNRAIESVLVGSIPAIASVSVHAENFHTISVSIVERHPKAVWCGSDPHNPQPCFLMDESGRAYGAALDFSNNVYTRYFGSLTSNAPKQYLSPSEFRSLSALVDTVATSQKTMKLVSVFVDQNRDVYVVFDSGFTLLFALSADGGDVYQRFTLALQSEPFKSHALSEFEYLDLRFGDKLYYKLKATSQ